MTRKALAAAALMTFVSGCAVSNVTNTPETPSPAARNAQAVTPQEGIRYSYVTQVQQIVAGHAETILRRQEREGVKKTGHPVALPTGACVAVAILRADGTVQRTDLGECASEALGKILLEAIRNSSPLPPTPFGHNASIMVHIVQPDTAPGLGKQ